MITNIKKVYFHIKGMETSKEREGIKGEPNYILASLNYDSVGGLCYFWDIRPVYKYMLGDVEMVAEPFSLAVATPYLRESLVRCGRKTSKKEAQAIELFDSNVVSAITHRLKYNIDLEGEMNGYFKTEDLQWCKKVSDYEFDFVEVRINPEEGFSVVAGNVDLTDYSEDEQKPYVEGYYQNLDNVKTQYPNDYAQIIAECIFEQTQEVELTCFGPYSSEDDAEKEAERYIKAQKITY